MSQECYDNLVAELRHMEQVELPQVRDAIAEARDKGDLSENFEYHAAKREQGRLLGRIRYKQKVLENARVIDKTRLKSDVVGITTAACRIPSSALPKPTLPNVRFLLSRLLHRLCSTRRWKTWLRLGFLQEQ